MKKIIAISSKTLAILVILSVLFSSVVTFSAASPKLSKTKKTLIVGKSFTLTLKNATKKFTWTTSNKNVAKLISVKKNSVKIKGVKAGTATVTVKIGSKKLKCKITVKEKPQPVEESVPDEQQTTKEYLVVSIKALPKYTSAMSEMMNKYAQEGWIVKSTAATNDYIFITFERDKAENNPSE